MLYFKQFSNGAFCLELLFYKICIIRPSMRHEVGEKSGNFLNVFKYHEKNVLGSELYHIDIVPEF